MSDWPDSCLAKLPGGWLVGFAGRPANGGLDACPGDVPRAPMDGPVRFVSYAASNSHLNPRKETVESLLSPLGALLAEIREEHHRQQPSGRESTPAAASLGSSETSVGPAPVHSPLGTLLAEIREAQHLRHSVAGKRTPVAAGSKAGRPEPGLSLETRVLTHPAPGLSAKPWLFPASFVLHVSLVVGAIAVPLFRHEVLPEPTAAVKVFFAEPPAAPPPPPPAPRQVNAPAAGATPLPPEAAKLTAPIEVLETVNPEAGLGAGAEDGGAGGVEGGIPGGVAGGIVGGLPQPSPPPKPMRIEGQIKEPTKLKHVAPIYPDIAIRANIRGSVVLECLVSPQGRVMEVRILKGIPVLNDAALAAVKQWLYTPTLVDGVPVTVILTVTLQFNLEDARPVRPR